MNASTSEKDPPPSPGPWRRILFTPVRDLIGLRAPNRLSINQMLIEAALPSALADLILLTTKKTRLTRAERADVASEFISHFRDGMESGASPDELVESFGEPRRVAKLIRRAKKRNRPMPWRVAMKTIKTVGLCLAAFIVFYLACGLYMLAGKPNVSVDYLAKVNATATSVPADERAWPHYREALLQLEKIPSLRTHSRQPMPGEPGWETFEAYLDEQAEALNIVRQAAQYPTLGFVVGWTFSEEDLKLWPGMDSHAAEIESKGGCLFNISINHLVNLRELAKTIALNIDRAAAEGDGARVVADTEVMLTIASHAREILFLINDLVGWSIVTLTVERVGDAVAHHPEAFSDDHLQELAHRFSACDELMRVRFDGERWGFEDLLQRIYTDDGEGDGRITINGIRKLSSISGVQTGSYSGEYSISHGTMDVLIAPALNTITASRKEMLLEYNRLLDICLAESKRPLWERDYSRFDNEITSYDQELFYRMRYLPVSLLIPALEKVSISAEHLRQRRDALLVAFALEMYHRQHKAWPDSLDDLVPSLLPAVPPDCFDGQPLRYTLVDGQPLLYSVGNDRNDDGGKPPVYPNTGRPNYLAASGWTSAEALANDPVRVARNDGDWILWPRPIEELIVYPEDEE